MNKNRKEQSARHRFAGKFTGFHGAADTNGPAAYAAFNSPQTELNLVGPNPLVYRTKANCLRVCTRGPIAVVYPC